MRGYIKKFNSVVHVLNALTKSGKLSDDENAILKKLIKDLGQAVDTKNEKRLRVTIGKICSFFVKKAV